MERFEYTFNNGLQMTVVLGEDGFNVNISGGTLEQPLMGIFTDFEEMLYALAPTVQENITCKEELLFIASHIRVSFIGKMEKQKIVDILMK